MKPGFFTNLTPEQQEKALSYQGPENHGTQRIFVECDCHDPYHHIVFDYDTETRDILVYVQMKNYLPFHKRLVSCFNYLFNRHVPRIDYVEAMFSDKKTITEMRDFFNHAIDEHP